MHPLPQNIRRRLRAYLAENTAAAWQQFSNACNCSGLDPETVLDNHR